LNFYGVTFVLTTAEICLVYRECYITVRRGELNMVILTEPFSDEKIVKT